MGMCAWHVNAWRRAFGARQAQFERLGWLRNKRRFELFNGMNEGARVTFR
jgi:hypothetical protein